MKFITSRNIKFVAILLVFLTLISLSLSTETKSFEGKRNPNQKCIMIQEMRLQEEMRDDVTRKMIFFVLLGYFYSVYL